MEKRAAKRSHFTRNDLIIRVLPERTLGYVSATRRETREVLAGERYLISQERQVASGAGNREGHILFSDKIINGYLRDRNGG